MFEQIPPEAEVDDWITEYDTDSLSDEQRSELPLYIDSLIIYQDSEEGEQIRDALCNSSSLEEDD